MSLKVWLPLNGDLHNQGCSNFNITTNTATIDNNGKIGSCYSFASGNKMQTNFSISTYPWSVACWFYSTKSSASGHQYMVSMQANANASDNFLFSLCLRQNKITARLSGTSYSSDDGAINQNIWYHGCVTYDGTNLKIYLNGNEVYNSNSVVAPTAATVTIFGQRLGNTGNYVGKLNDVRIYDHCLSAAEVREISQGLVLHYKLDNISNGIQDSSGYNNNGTAMNTVTTSTDTPRYTLSTSLPNGNSRINCGRGGMVKDSITVNFWCKYSSWGVPVSCTESGGWNMQNDDGSITFLVYLASIGYVHSVNGTGAISLPPANYANNWHMFTGIYNKAEKTVSLYIDGELKQQNIASAGNNIAYHESNCIWIGAEATNSNTTASNGMAGLFSDFRIYCTALDADAIRQLYEVGAKIDDKQNLHTFELIEDQSSIKITKRGQVKCDDLTESTTTKFYKSKDINTNNLIEL